ncbi:MAG: hypothetical protein JWO05_2649 [Gemmatimonadetes bacterium]|nr:hypothetical protein [Gemmatimonadota bacterium]
MAGVGIVLSVETLVLHLWLAQRHPLVAWALTLSTLSTLWWLLSDYRSMARSAVIVGDEAITLAIGKRFSAVIPRRALFRVEAVTWRDVPDVIPRDALNATKPAEPNVRLTFHEPVTIRMLGALDRQARTLGLHVDHPAEFLAYLSAPSLDHSLAASDPPHPSPP